MDDNGDNFAKGRDFLQIFNKVAEFTKELLQQNEALKSEISLLEEAQATGAGNSQPDLSSTKIRQAIKQLEEEKIALNSKYQEVEAENKDFAKRYIDIEEENNNMANLYVASYQLHSTLDAQEVLSVIMEIVINLIGAEVFGLYLLDGKTQNLHAVAMEGFELSECPAIPLRHGIIGTVAAGGEIYVGKSLTAPEDLHPTQPLVAIPLKIQSEVIGTIVIYQLLEQKKTLSHVDFEMFTMLAGHAATAIFSSRMYEVSERKSQTYQGFLDLLTQGEDSSEEKAVQPRGA